MVNPSDTAPEASTEQAQARAGAATVVRPSLRAQVAENPLLSFFGLLIVALLAAAIASPHIRIDDINIRIDRLEAKVDRLEAKVDRLEVRVDRLEARFIELRQGGCQVRPGGCQVRQARSRRSRRSTGS